MEIQAIKTQINKTDHGTNNSDSMMLCTGFLKDSLIERSGDVESQEIVANVRRCEV